MIPRWIGFYRTLGQRRTGTAFERELQESGYADELWAFIRTWAATGYILPRWRHPQPGTAFAAIGPPGSTVRVYYAEHAGQIVLLHVSSTKHGRGKLPAHVKALVDRRLAQWRAWFPQGAALDEEDRLIQRRTGGN